MIKLIRWMLGLCNHTWEEYGIPVEVYSNADSKMPVRVEQTFMCKKCATTKQVKV